MCKHIWFVPSWPPDTGPAELDGFKRCGAVVNAAESVGLTAAGVGALLRTYRDAAIDDSTVTAFIDTLAAAVRLAHHRWLSASVQVCEEGYSNSL